MEGLFIFTLFTLFSPVFLGKNLEPGGGINECDKAVMERLYYLYILLTIDYSKRKYNKT